MLRKFICAVLTASLLMGAGLAMDRDALRAAWREQAEPRSDESPYAERPDPENFTLGSLTEAAQADALALTNFIRSLAGLAPVSLDPLYNLRAQAGALVLAANDALTHTPEQPAGMEDGLFEVGYAGTSMGNIAKFNWMRPSILIDGVTYFARDDGDINLGGLGHRRWLLNPYMRSTGFGLANAATGNSYVAMYAVDMDNANVEWDCVTWPAGGAFPVELMRAELPWSISLNPEIYDIANSEPVLTLTEEISGAAFRFDFSEGGGDGFCLLSTDNYGAGPCLIFRPELSAAGIDEYVQNQIWTVELTGLRGMDGAARELRYTCEMASVYPQDVANVELDTIEASLAPGETLRLSAAVIPAYADDLTVVWRSSDEDVATVDETGLVTAVASGTCEITAESVNGRGDTCAITVE